MDGSLPDTTRLFRRSLAVVAVSQLLSGAGLAAGITVGALLASDMLGSDSLAGLSAALFTLGSAGAAFGVGRISQRSGRRAGLSTGFLIGSLGAAGVVAAAALRSPLLLFASFLLYGAGFATNLQARYAGTDLAPPDRRATAVSVVLVATTFGAVLGPNLVEPLGGFAAAVGLPRLAGPFLLGGAAFALAGLFLLALLRPDPLLEARRLAAAGSSPAAVSGETPRAAPGALVRHRPLAAGVAVGTTVMVLTQLAMVAIMTMTPIEMIHHGLSLRDVGLVIAIHICAMFLPSLVTGPLVDRVGRVRMAVASAATLLAAGIVAFLAPPGSVPVLLVALGLLGLGWNFGLISGTALIIDATPPETRARTQGSTDVLVALAGAAGGAASGLVVAASSFSLLALAGGILSLLLIPVVVWSRRQPATV